MKALKFCFLILSLSVLLSNATGPLDYSTLQKWKDDSTCTRTNVFESPAKLLSEKCAPYEKFEINLPSLASTAFTFNSDKGCLEVAYTTGTLTVNDHSFQTSSVLFRTPAEHRLPNQDSTSSMEIQIELVYPSATSTVVGALSIILLSDKDDKGRQNSKAILEVVTTFSSTNVALNFDGLTQNINQKISSGVYLNLFEYQGTKTYPSCDSILWYVYGSALAIDSTKLDAAVQALISSSVTLPTPNTNGGNNRPIGVTGGGSGSLGATRLCYTGYFKNYMNYNYGLWFGIVSIVGWFIVNLMLSEKPVKDSDYQENTWTNHPLYSIHHVGNDLFTIKTRMSLLLGTVTIHALFSSVWYRRTHEENRTRGSNIIVYAVYSMLVSWAFIYIIGFMLRGYYVAKHQYYKTRDEGWHQKSQNRLFGFYFCIFLCAVILWPFTVWNMGELHPEKDQKASDYWVASFFVGLALELLIVDPIICLLAKGITPLRNMIKYRGYMYDHICHETYLDYLKMD